MTLTEFISQYKRCAINNIPKERIADIFEIVAVAPMAQHMRDRLSGYIKDSLENVVSFRFQDGQWVNFMRSPQTYKPSSPHALEAVIGFDELDFEPEEIDFSSIFELC